ncbi:hypothetical protein Tco_0834042 [Tanacetum coccineum]
MSWIWLGNPGFWKLSNGILGVKGSTSSHTHGWDKSSSSLRDFFPFDLDFQYLPLLSLLSERASVYFALEFRL